MTKPGMQKLFITKLLQIVKRCNYAHHTYKKINNNSNTLSIISGIVKKRLKENPEISCSVFIYKNIKKTSQEFFSHETIENNICFEK